MRRHHRAAAVLALSPILVAACTSDGLGPGADTTAPATSEMPTTSRSTDDSASTVTVDPDAVAIPVGVALPTTSGNPVLPGRLDLGAVTEIGAFDAPVGRLRGFDTSGATWQVATDGRIVDLDLDELRPGEPLGRVLVDPRQMADDPLPDGIPVWSGTTMVVLTEPTDRYGHGVLGDAVEAGAFEILTLAAEPTELEPHPEVLGRVRVEIAAPAVIEGIAALLADLDGDGVDEVIATEADPSNGARMVAFELDGTPVVRGRPVGRGNRWRNQLGVGPLGPNGEIEFVDVETPHIGGDVGWFRLGDGELGQQIVTGDFSTHRIGSRILDQGVLVDVHGDGRPEVVVPTQDQRTLVALSRTVAGVEIVASLDLGARLTSNLAGVSDGSRAVLAVGLDDGRVLRLGRLT